MVKRKFGCKFCLGIINKKSMKKHLPRCEPTHALAKLQRWIVGSEEPIMMIIFKCIINGQDYYGFKLILAFV